MQLELGVAGVILLCTFAGIVSASSERTESLDYTLLVSNVDPKCGSFAPGNSPVCFSILPGETHVVVSIQEESPTATSQFSIAGRMTFIGGHSPHVHFCGETNWGIPAGATDLVIEVHTRTHGSLCDGLVDPSPAVQGTVTATFT